MSHPIRSYFKKKITFMVIPHDGEKSAHLKMHLCLVHGVLLAAAGLVGWALYLSGQDVDYRLARLNDQRIRASMQEVADELQTNRQLLSGMAGVDSQFRKLLKLGDRKTVLEYNGMGGPTEQDSSRFSKLLEEKNEQLLTKIQAGLQQSNREASRQEASFRQISLYLDKQRSILAATPDIWPVKGWVTSGFGKRMNPLTDEPGVHMGVDIANEVNTPIHATADGLVTYAGWESGYGRVVVIEHGYGFSTRYGHCNRLEVKVGDEVKRGQVIGYMGSTGMSTGSHCHYEVRIHGVPVNPIPYLPKID
ncbi:MAG TPA: M23 family metallopeptidase [bacterium]|nr:M23 family metallopeptidase [bacterium]